jgi:hypothetical protein
MAADESDDRRHARTRRRPLVAAVWISDTEGGCWVFRPNSARRRRLRRRRRRACLSRSLPAAELCYGPQCRGTAKRYGLLINSAADRAITGRFSLPVVSPVVV